MPKRTDKNNASFAPYFREIKAEREAGVTPEREEELRIKHLTLSTRYRQNLPPKVTDQHTLRTIAGIILSN